jgi:hypothetical protein
MDFYAVYEELTARPIVVQIDASTTVPLDALHFVEGIRRQLGREGLITRIPLLVNELRSGDREKAARVLVAPDSLLNPTAMLVITYDVCGATLRDAVDAANARARDPFRDPITSKNCDGWQTQAAHPSTYAPSEQHPHVDSDGRVRRSGATETRLIGAPQNSHYEIPGAVHGRWRMPGSNPLQFLEAPTRARRRALHHSPSGRSKRTTRRSGSCFDCRVGPGNRLAGTEACLRSTERDDHDLRLMVSR